MINSIENTMKLRFLGLLLFLMAIAVSCKKEDVPACRKIMYVMEGDVNVVTYQWMTMAEAQAVFSQYEDVRIYTMDCEQVDCLIKNLE